ncbi:GPP34 family phosphoprotein [Streptomyces sp. NPDC097619]|uniref:GOLPH3/VPS74 family protein n=1 Tax=Streptomyces sp. NPDC097619 TaxID=3157228 RepID=UPI00331C5FC9
MTFTLAEEVVLLSLDGRSAPPPRHQAADWAAAGALLLELVMAGRVSLAGKHLELIDPTPTGLPLLDGRTALIGAWLRGRSKRRVADWLTNDRPKAFGAAAQALREHGIVEERKHHGPGAFPVRRSPGSDASAEWELRARLAAVVLDGAEPDPRTAGLVALLHSVELHELALPGGPRRLVAERAAEIAAGAWAAEPLRTAVRDVRAAMTAATALTAAG